MHELRRISRLRRSQGKPVKMLNIVSNIVRMSKPFFKTYSSIIITRKCYNKEGRLIYLFWKQKQYD